MSLFLEYGILENKYLFGAFVLGCLMQVGVVVFEPVANVFRLVALSKIQWVYTIAISFVPLVIVELQKWFNGVRFGKVVYATKENSRIS